MKYFFDVGDEGAKNFTKENKAIGAIGSPLKSFLVKTSYGPPTQAGANLAANPAAGVAVLSDSEAASRPAADHVEIPPSDAAKATVPFPENIRLVIWDLDETFWKGTLTEGQITWIDEHENIVRSLAARGIVSSICSKNYFDPTMEVIKARALDGYFIFPSIDWSQKGHRVKAIVENAQLRPETVLFIDDNHLNRAEVADTNPGINVVAETFIPHILGHGRFAGKDDSELTRLAQYKAMELRKSDAANANENGDEFLRTSAIKVYIEYDLEANIDRCVELINRTNQLNFTKVRLSDDTGRGRQEFLELLRDPRIQGGLIHCRDKYGDHGFVGLYLISEGRTLKHFMFSCRVLGMGVEQWLYQRLGNPYLNIVGEVLSDPRDTSRNVDWIELVADKDGASDTELPSAVMKIDNFYVLGGCVMENIGHYLKVFSTNVIHEGNARRDGIDIRRTHTSFMVYRHLVGNPQFAEAVRGLGCVREDFDNQIFRADARSGIVLSFWYDQICVLYRHKKIPIEMPFLIDGISWDADITRLNFDDMPAEFKGAKDSARIFHHFKENFTFGGYISAESYGERLRVILSQINPDTPIFLLDIPRQTERSWGGERQIQPDMLEPISNVHKQLAHARKNTWLIDPVEFVLAAEDRMDWWHFDRKVYYRIYKRIAELIAAIEPTR
ncbi:MAG TPA: hypothetical protein VIF60_22610 [Burkholderiaceae bacterium]|jgi:FkbH-like protein